MALSITGTARENGPGCDHLVVSVNVEGNVATMKLTLAGVDAMIPDDQVEAGKLLVVLWAAYRRKFGRAIVGVVIA